MAMQEQQRLLRIGDVILLYYDGNRGREQEAVASDNPDGPGITGGYVFSELRSSEHNAVALFPAEKEHPNLPNVHCKLIMRTRLCKWLRDLAGWIYMSECASLALQLQPSGCLQRTSMRLKRDSTN